jgi:hypothetical protein
MRQDSHWSASTQRVRRRDVTAEPVIAGQSFEPDSGQQLESPWHPVLRPIDVYLRPILPALMFNSHRIRERPSDATGGRRYPAAPAKTSRKSRSYGMDRACAGPRPVCKRSELRSVRPSFVGTPMHLRGQRVADQVRLWATADRSGLMTAFAPESISVAEYCGA